jgi:phage shock protein A
MRLVVLAAVLVSGLVLQAVTLRRTQTEAERRFVQLEQQIRLQQRQLTEQRRLLGGAIEQVNQTDDEVAKLETRIGDAEHYARVTRRWW